MNTWRHVSNPPVMDQNDCGWPTSKPVLGFDRVGNMLVVTREQIDPDFPAVWYTSDSERWTVTGEILYWMPLPPPPMGEIAIAKDEQ